MMIQDDLYLDFRLFQTNATGAAPVTRVEKDPFIRPVNEEKLLAHGPAIHLKLVKIEQQEQGFCNPEFWEETFTCLTKP